MLAAYEHGKSNQDVDMVTIAYQDDRWDDWMADPVCRLWWSAGYDDAPMPMWVKAVRYGNIPACGVSVNYRDDQAERGVSVARLLDDPDAYDWQDQLWGADTRPLVTVCGWLHYRRGSDGEPLLVGAEVAR